MTTSKTSHTEYDAATRNKVFNLPMLFRMESMWNPWNLSGIPYGIHGMNVGWDPSQFLIPWTSWIPHGMRMEWSWTDQFHMDSTWIPQDSIWNAGISTLDSMEQIQFHVNSTGIPGKPPYFITKNSSIMKNRTLDSTRDHVMYSLNTLSAMLRRHW